MKSARASVAGATAILLALGTGILIGAERADRTAEIRDLTARVNALTARVERSDAERARLRAERNGLEARLAAGRPRATCPQDFVSTDSAELIPFFAVEYPCGWHVLYDARSSISVEERRPGLHVEVALFSRLPISLRPRQEPIADIELADWSDDPADKDDALAPIEAWVSDERKQYEGTAREDRFEAGDGVTIHRLRGTQRLFDEPVEVHVMLWEYEDSFNGQRHVVRAFALQPSAVVRGALDRMARSFRVLER